MGSSEGPILAASDYMRLNSDQIRSYITKVFTHWVLMVMVEAILEKNLRKFFEVDKNYITTYALSVLANEQLLSSKYAVEAIKKYKIDAEKPMPTKV